MTIKNPYVWQRITLDLFYGREHLVSAILSDLYGCRSIALVGGRKIGKTTVLRWLEAELVRALAAGSHSISVIPAYLDVLSLSHPLSQYTLYFEILREFETHLAAAGIPSVMVKQFESRTANGSHEFTEFRAAVLDFLSTAGAVRDFRFAVLVDEVGPITSTDWANGFFANWRHLLSNDPLLSPRIVAIFTGAKEMSALSTDMGSPIANVLNLRAVEPLNWPAIRALVNEPTHGQLPERVARDIFTLTGGHPFLAQFLMQQICNEDHLTASSLSNAKKTFYSTQGIQFVNWWNERFNEDDRKTYILIGSIRQGASISNISTKLKHIDAERAVSSLRLYGVIRLGQGGAWKTNGSLFKSWVLANTIDSTDLSGPYDLALYQKLLATDEEIARKYLSAWGIYATTLDNYSGAVSEMRDVLTLVLHHLAPDDQVCAEKGYITEVSQTGSERPGPTRRQRVEFIVRRQTRLKRLDEEIALLDTLAEQAASSAVRIYGVASGRTHKTSTKNEAWQALKQLESILAQIL